MTRKTTTTTIDETPPPPGDRKTRVWVAARLATAGNALERLCRHTDGTALAIEAIGDAIDTHRDLVDWITPPASK